MGLRCLIGHDYGPPETEREREERGDEEVVTIREFKECRRCGDRRVISENTEVRAKDPPAEVGETPAVEAPPEQDDSAGEIEGMTAEEDDGVILSEEESAERSSGEWPDAGDGEVENEDGTAEGVAGSDDDGPGEDASEREEQATESPDSDAEPSEEEGREWPEANHREEERDPESREWPETEGEDEGYDAVADDEPVEDVEFGGLTPERSDESGSEGAEVAPAGITSASPGPQPIGPQRSDAGRTVLVCPECEHVAGGQGPSLRPGDICPECRRGYLAERESE